MDTIDFKLYIYESMMSGDISPGMGDKLLELVYESDEYITEKKSREQYVREKFKKKYKYDQKTGTIDIGNGERMKVDIGNSKRIMYDTVPRQTMVTGEGDIYIDKNFWKGTKNQKERDALINHEIGHNKIHMNSPHQDKRFIDESFMLEICKKELCDMGVDPNSNDGKQALKFYKESDWWKYTVNMAKTDENIKKIRDKFISHAKKYLRAGNQHLNLKELEADRFGANKTSSKTMANAMKHISKYSMKDKNLDNYCRTAGIDPNSNEGKKFKAQTRKISDQDRLVRGKALKDRELAKHSSIYKTESYKDALFETILEKYSGGELSFEEADILIDALFRI